jgi:hypothetical protein
VPALDELLAHFGCVVYLPRLVPFDNLPRLRKLFINLCHVRPFVDPRAFQSRACQT